ncbi:LCP family protein [Microbacterium sp. GXS0129]|uniref:LCP family protein n=1 Tax=Microbacterium sp. GXS0129 TaxID=3377836 RepID=UPI00383BD36A
MSAASPERSRRRTIARHGRLRTPRPIAQLLTLVGVAVATVMVAGIGLTGYVTYDLASSYAADATDIGGEVPPSIAEIQGGANILVAGTDVCEPQYAQYFGDRCAEGLAEEGARSDVNLVVHISEEPRKITVISFPRDLMVPIPECTDANGNVTSAMSKQMLNSAFDTGGLACTVATIEQLTGMDIQYAASVNWGGVMAITDAVGGVTVCLASPIRDPYTGIDWPAGERTIQGLEALQFLRTRHGVGNGGDLGRISNQQQYMSRLARKMMSSEVLTNPATLLKLAKTTLSAIDPSTSLTNPVTLVQLAMAVKDVPFEDIVFVQYPVYDDPSDPNRVVPDEAAASILLTALANNSALQITGDAGVGVVAEGATPTDGATDGSTDGAVDGTDSGSVEAPADGATLEPTPSTAPDGSVLLPSQITGTTAAQSTCSNGQVN